MIEDTSKRDHFTNLVGLIGGRTPDEYITDMEADGQRQVVAATDLLPKRGPWDELQTLGFGAPEPSDDDLFVRTTLPDGWAKRGTDHSMHSVVVDERGVERVGIFYKAAFYDRRAECHIIRPGYRLATSAIYGDDAPSLPDSWDVLTEEERADFRSELGTYMRQVREMPNVYGDRAERVKALLEAAR